MLHRISELNRQFMEALLNLPDEDLNESEEASDSEQSEAEINFNGESDDPMEYDPSIPETDDERNSNNLLFSHHRCCVKSVASLRRW